MNTELVLVDAKKKEITRLGVKITDNLIDSGIIYSDKMKKYFVFQYKVKGENA